MNGGPKIPRRSWAIATIFVLLILLAMAAPVNSEEVVTFAEDCDGPGTDANATNTNFSSATTGADPRSRLTFDTSEHCANSTCSIKSYTKNSEENKLRTPIELETGETLRVHLRKGRYACVLMTFWCGSDKPLLVQWMVDSNDLYAYTGDGPKLVNDTLGNTWYKIEVSLNFTSQTFEIALDGDTQSLDNSTFYEPTSGTVSSVEFCFVGSSSANVAYIDELDIYYTTPPIPPTAEAGDDQSTETETNITLDGSGSTDDGTISNYSWDMGDGHTKYGKTITHSYATAGTYTVTLTVTDDLGATDTDTLTVTVSNRYPYLEWLWFFIAIFIIFMISIIIHAVTS